MQPRSDCIGIELSYEDREVAGFAITLAATKAEKGEPVPHNLIGDELVLKPLTETQSLLLDRATSHTVIAAARLAMQESDQRLWLAKNRYTDLRHDHAEVEVLQLACAEIYEEGENVNIFSKLFEAALKALNESEDIAIDNGLKARSA